MNDLSPFVRFINKTNFFIPNSTIIANDCHILYNLKDELTIKIQRKQYVLKAHSLIYYPYGMPYSIHSTSSNILFYTANFDLNKNFTTVKSVLRPQRLDSYNPQNNLDSISPELHFIFKKTIYIENAANLEKHFEDMYKETVNRSLNWSSIQDEFMGIILNKLHRITSTPTTSDPICDEIKKIIKLNSTNISNLEIAEILGYHPNYINDVFKRNEGITIHQYVLQKKLSKAYELISTTDISYENIADICGFSSAAHLTTSIKKKYNLTPSEIRKQL